MPIDDDQAIAHARAVLEEAGYSVSSRPVKWRTLTVRVRLKVLGTYPTKDLRRLVEDELNNGSLLNNLTNDSRVFQLGNMEVISDPLEK